MNFKSILMLYVAVHIFLFVNGKLTPNIEWNFVGSFLIFFYLTIYCIKKINENKPNWKVLRVLIVIRLLLLGGYDLYVRLTEELYGSPVLIIHLLGIVSGFFYIRLKNPFNLLPLMFSSVFVTFMFLQGFELYLHKLNYGTFTGRIEAYKLQKKVEGTDQNNNKINNQTLENKIVLLDFWHSRCGVCFQKFPQLQAFYDKYKDDDSIVVFAVNKPIEEDKQKSVFKVIEDRGYNFPVLLPIDEELPDKFGVFRFPATFVIDKYGNVVYKGGIEGAILMVEELKKL
jgi:thiol-disulfide isomerase/thioredoxin